MHSRTVLVERTIGSIKHLVKTFLSENFGLKDSVRKALGNLRLKPHSKIKLSPFELQFGRKPNTEIRNTVAKGISNFSDWMKIIDQLKSTGYNVSDNPNTSLIYAFRDNAGRDIDNLSFTPDRAVLQQQEPQPSSPRRRQNTGNAGRGRSATPVSKYILEKDPRAKAYHPPYKLIPQRVKH